MIFLPSSLSGCGQQGTNASTLSAGANLLMRLGTNLCTLVFNGADITQTITGSNTFANLRIAHTGSGTVNATSATLTVSGLSEVLSGIFKCSGTFNNFNISNGGTFNVPASQLVSLSGDLISDGESIPNTSTFFLSGVARQTLAGTENREFFNFILDNAKDVSLESGISVANALTLTLRIIDSNENKLIMGSLGFSGLVKGADSNRFVYGILKRYVPNEENLSIDFPIGEYTDYTPVVLNFNGTISGYLEASSAAFAPSVAELPTGAGLSLEKVLRRRWEASNSGVGGFWHYSAVLNFVAADILGDTDPNSLFASRFLDGIWSEETTGTRTFSSTGVTSLSSFGEFVLGEGCAFRFIWLGLTSDWSDPSNWCGNDVLLLEETGTILIPLTSSDPIILGTASISLNAEVILLEGARLVLKPGASFTLNSNSNISTEANVLLVLEGGLNYSNHGEGTPVLEVQQLLEGAKSWRMLGSPVMTNHAGFLDSMVTQGFVGSVSSTLQCNLLWWEETDKGTTLQGSRQPANTSQMVSPGRGYHAYVFNGATKPSDGLPSADNLPIILKSTGVEPNIRNRPFDFGVSFTRRDTSLTVLGDGLLEVNVSDEGFNLLANPSAGVIDCFAPSGWSKTNVDEVIYVWDPNYNSGQGSFLTYMGMSGNLNSGLLASFQGFWVRTNADSPILTLGNTAKSILSKEYVGRKSSQNPLSIQLYGEGMKADSFIEFGENGKEGQHAFDAYQLESLSDNWLILYTYGSLRTKSPLVINSLSVLEQQERSIPLRIAAAKDGKAINGNYRLYWELPADWPSEVSLVLMEHLQQKAIDVKIQNGYDFNFNAPEIQGNLNSKLGNGGMKAPSAMVFLSPYQTSEPNQRVNISTPMRPFSHFGGGEYLSGEIAYRPDFPKLFAPVPNPFKTKVKINFYLPIETEVEIRVLDMYGIDKAAFPYKNHKVDVQEIEIEEEAFASGLYIVQLLAAGELTTQKLTKN